MRIKHKVPNYSLSKLKQRFKLWLDTHGPGNGWYVYARLTEDGAQLNYNNKRLREIQSAKLLNTGFEMKEMTRLSSEMDGLQII